MPITSSLALERVWRQTRSPAMPESEPSVLSCIGTSFVVPKGCKHSSQWTGLCPTSRVLTVGRAYPRVRVAHYVSNSRGTGTAQIGPLCQTCFLSPTLP